MGQIVISGTSSGIGKELAIQYLTLRLKVVGIGRSPCGEEFKKFPQFQYIGGVDFQKSATMKSLKDHPLLKESIDILINNAGIFETDNLDKLDLEMAEVERNFVVNSMAPLRLFQALRTHLAPEAKLAFVTSRMGSIGDNTTGGSYAYRMSKAALNAGVKSLALDLRTEGKSVILLHPGYVKTKMTGFSGDIGPEQSAEGIRREIENLNIKNTGRFRHANGTDLPW
jgi:NAD(P)-dependent dehydrogenase (short-subunit alcohol dehydrogenase family)